MYLANANVTPNAVQFRLIKQWLHYIRLFLRRNQGGATFVWDELLKIRDRDSSLRETD